MTNIYKQIHAAFKNEWNKETKSYIGSYTYVVKRRNETAITKWPKYSSYSKKKKRLHFRRAHPQQQITGSNRRVCCFTSIQIELALRQTFMTHAANPICSFLYHKPNYCKLNQNKAFSAMSEYLVESKTSTKNVVMLERRIPK